MANIDLLNLVTNITYSPSSFPSSKPSTLMVGDRLNMGGNTKHPLMELEFMIQFGNDNHPIMKSWPVDMWHTILFPFPEAASLANLKEEDIVTFMPKLHWINNDI